MKDILTCILLSLVTTIIVALVNVTEVGYSGDYLISMMFLFLVLLIVLFYVHLGARFL